MPKALQQTANSKESKTRTPLTVQDLLEILQEVEDKTLVVKIAVHQYNKGYPVCYEEPHLEGSQAWGEYRIHVSLPNNMRTRTIKEGGAK